MNADKALELARLAYPNDENLRVAYMLGLNAGAEWQKEQMLKDAVEGTVHANTNARWVEAEVSREDGFICGDKVRIVVLKEEE